MPSRRVKPFYMPPSLVLRQAFSLAYHGWLSGWASLPGWMLKGKKVLKTAAGATGIGCTGYPYHVVWEITTRCNLNCIHCYASSVDSTKNELTTAEGKRLLEQIAAVRKIRMIVITGGEPLLRKDIFELIEYAGKLGFYIIFSTNGTLLTPEMAKDLAKLGVANFSISLDGFTEQCHETIRRKTGSFKAALEGIKAAAQTGACLQVNFTAMQQNLAELPGLIDLAESLKTDIIMVFQAIPPQQERGAKALNAEQQMGLMKTIAEKQKKSKSLIIPVCCPEYWPMLLEKKPFKLMQKSAFNGCGAGRGFSYIRFDGDVWPCNFIPALAGNVRDRSFAEIWEHSPLLNRYRHYNVKGLCGECNYLEICGGCRGRALAQTGDVFAADPACLIKR
jgi:radical SAM protein with 4Fe4S-binding SPASM domain